MLKKLFWISTLITFAIGFAFHPTYGNMFLYPIDSSIEFEQRLAGALGFVAFPLIVLFFMRKTESRRLKAYKIGIVLLILLIGGRIYSHVHENEDTYGNSYRPAQTQQQTNTKPASSNKLNSQNSYYQPAMQQTYVSQTQESSTMVTKVCETFGVRFSLQVPYDWTVENVGSDGVKILSPSRLNWLGITVARNDEHLQAKAVIDGYKQGIGSDLKVNSEKSSGPNYYFLNGEFRGYRVEMMGLIDNAGYIHGYITINDVPIMTDIVNSVRILNY